jgi:hypothetical protein
MSGYDNTSETVRATALTTDTLTNNDFVLFVNATAATTINLPAVATVQPGRPYRIVKDAAAFTVTIDGAAAETINGAATLVLASGAFHGAILVSTGTAWIAEALY